jgi:AraC-like DNA-binding protein
MNDLRELAALIEQNTEATVDSVTETAISHLSLYRWSQVTKPLHAAYEPCICVVAQGSKRTVVGEGVYPYGAGQYLVSSVDIPIVGQVTDANANKPFLALLLRLDPAAVGELMLETGFDRAARPGPALGISVAEPALIDACVRLLRLLSSAEDIPVMAPLVEKEILYRLLRGPQASRISRIALADSRLPDIHRAIDWIKKNFQETLSTETLASVARMSASALHQHFKTVTGMSPLQYQKNLRLHEARRLMLSEAVDAAVAGHSVGYESPSQFSREYRRLFGAPPVRDIAALRNLTGGIAERSLQRVARR